MTIAGWFEIALRLALTLAAAYPIGFVMADVFEGRRTFLGPVLAPVERALYRIAGIDEKAEHKWDAYAVSMVLFGGACLFAIYAILRLQAYLPLNPQGFPERPARSRLRHRGQLYHQHQLAGLRRRDDAESFFADGRSPSPEAAPGVRRFPSRRFLSPPARARGGQLRRPFLATASHFGRAIQFRREIFSAPAASDETTS
jgi:hypothetical protein